MMFPIEAELQTTRHLKNEIKKRILKNADVLYEDMEAVHELERFFERVVKGGSYATKGFNYCRYVK